MHTWFQLNRALSKLRYPLFPGGSASTFNEETAHPFFVRRNQRPENAPYIINRQIDEIVARFPATMSSVREK